VRKKLKRRKRAVFIVWAVVVGLILFSVTFYIVKVLFSLERENVFSKRRDIALDIAISEMERILAGGKLESFEKKVEASGGYYIFEVEERAQKVGNGMLLEVKVLPPSSKRWVVLRTYKSCAFEKE